MFKHLIDLLEFEGEFTEPPSFKRGYFPSPSFHGSMCVAFLLKIPRSLPPSPVWDPVVGTALPLSQQPGPKSADAALPTPQLTAKASG